MTTEATSTPIDRAITACLDVLDASWRAVDRLMILDIPGAWAIVLPSLDACATAAGAALGPHLG
jgi:hypothetical protein